MKEYNFKEIEPKWQKIWEEEKRFETKDKVEGKQNAYVLVEFPYPSGAGLHMGHMLAYTAPDIVARKIRLQGKNVLFPFGVDAFGLEAERTAIREKKLPQEIVARNTAVFYEQIKTGGFNIDWSRTVCSSDPDFYKWTQWLFLQFFKRGDAYKGEANVNFCPNCGVLANEEVEDGTCCQCHAETVQKTKSQWMMRITKYADRLIDDLEKTDYLPYVKQSQINYIGRSSGVEVEFAIKGGGKFSIFTTCIETIYGITFMVLAPENKIVQELKQRIQNFTEVEQYIQKAAKKSEFERTEVNKDKSGCILKGIYAINPVNGKEVPVYIGDFVLAGYGTGAVMAVPSHDQRDYEFALHHKIPMLQVIEGDVSTQAVEKGEYISKNSKLLNSAEFSGLTVAEAKTAITEKLVKQSFAKETINYKLHDWVFSRQRYWGEPIPIINCPQCGLVPVPEEELPILLPPVKSYEPTKDGESPLAAISEFVNCTCPSCKGAAKRETDTMPGWAGSSWYFMRYADPHNTTAFASSEALKNWLPVGYYFGGNEHTTRHLLYARYWTKMLYDMQLVPVDEFCQKRYAHGILLGSDGTKMSKSLGNVVDPRAVIAEYGADALRLGIVFMGDYQDTFPWSGESVRACHKFLARVFALQKFLIAGDQPSKELNYVLNASIKKITEDIDKLKYNTAIAQLMIFLNEVQRIGKMNHCEYQTFLILLNPFAPHITEEIWTSCGFKPSIKDAQWPVFDEASLVREEVDIAVQLLGKMKGLIKMPYNASEEEAKVAALAKLNLSEAQVKKVIYVQNRIINLII